MKLVAWLILGVFVVAPSEPPLSAHAPTKQSAPVAEADKPAAANPFEAEIRALEALDQKEKDPRDAVLFVGSSSIRLWDSIAADMAPYPTIRRGFGGAKYSDLEQYAKRLIHPHEFRALVIFVANDVTGGPKDKTPDQVVGLVRSIINTARAKFATTPIFIVEITPTESRWAAWPKIRAVNAALAELCSDEEHVHWIATANSYLDQNDRPRGELFRADKLHQNADGYRVWSRIIKARLDSILK